MDNDVFFNIIIIVNGLLIGVIIGYIIFKEYKYKGPDSNIISKEIYTDINGKKYKWLPSVCICPIDLSMDKLKNPSYNNPDH